MRFAQRRGLALSMTLLLGAGVACGGKNTPEDNRVPIPAVSNLREASDMLVEQADQVEGKPDWVNHERDDGRQIYGIGTARAKRDAGQDLYSAMQSGRDSVVKHMRESGLETEAPLGFSDDLPQDPQRIQFSELVFDTEGRTWYVLAVLDKGTEAQEAADRLAELDDILDAEKATVLDPRTSDSDRVGAALTMLHVVDERAQWNARHAYFSGAALPEPQGLERDALVRLARSVLSEHQVRVVIEGARVPGVSAAVESVLGQYYMTTSEFGTGLVYVTLEESTSESADMELLILEGLMQLTLAGESGRTVSRPLRAVTTYDNLDAARARNARIIDAAAIDATREAILTLVQ